MGEGSRQHAAAVFFTLFASPALADEAVDLELVLAIDASSSVDDDEWELQRQGYAAAFRDPEIQARDHLRAEQAHRDRRRRLGRRHRAALGERLVRARRRLPTASASRTSWPPCRAFPIGGTGIGMGVAAAIRKLDRNGLTAPRQVVDVSGDGRETPPRENVVLMPMAHALAERGGVTVNGLAISNATISASRTGTATTSSPAGQLCDYGRGLSRTFGEAIRKKLLREISTRNG